MLKFEKMNLKNRRFVVLISLAFWIWLSKDLLFLILPIQLPAGQLISVILIVLLLLFLSGEPSFSYERGIQKYFGNFYVNGALVFFCYCFISGFISGDNAFTIFKLESLAIGVFISIILADKVVHAIALDKELFLLIGLIVGVSGYYSAFNDFKNISSFIGLRAVKVAHLNIQDFYVALFLFSAAILFCSGFRIMSLFYFLLTGILCVPLVISLNSRMIPFTVGATFVYLIYLYRTTILRNVYIRRFVALFVAAVVFGGFVAGTFMNNDTRMFQVFKEGEISSFENDPRHVSFAEAFDNFIDSPIYGLGFGKFSYPGIDLDPSDRLSGTWPHNIVLEILSELGIVGFIVFFIPILSVLRRVILLNKVLNMEYVVFPCLLFVYVFSTMQLTQNIFYPFLWTSYFCCVFSFRQENSLFTHKRYL